MSYASKSNSSDLSTRVMFTIFIVILCRFAAFIPIPGIDAVVLTHIRDHHDSGLLAMFNMLSGGSLGRMSIVALSIIPYVTSSIIIHLLSLSYSSLADLKKEGEVGRRKINQLTRYCTVLLAILESYGLSSNLYSMSASSGALVVVDVYFFKLSAVVSLVVGTMILMWLAEQINIRGFGNGTSIIIFSGIVSSIPSSVIGVFELLRSGSFSLLLALFAIIVLLLVVVVVIFVERAARKVPVQYPKRQVGNKIYGGDVSYMPLKLNTSGVLPLIFANSILSFPLTVANFSQDSILSGLGMYLQHGTPLYIVLYALLIIFTSFVYNSYLFNSEETADNLRKNGAYVPGYRPGQDTMRFFDYLLARLTCIGSMNLVFICIVPEIFMGKFSPVLLNFGGTSVLIVVSVILDTVSQIQTHVMSQKYDTLMKKMKLRER